MRKKAIALFMGALLFSTIGAFAQTENKGNNITCEQTSECCKNKKEKKDHKKGNKKHGQKARFNAFNGIELTAQQQQQIDALKAERKAKKEADKKQNFEQRKKDKEEFDQKVSKILTPEQFALYKANCDSLKVKKEKMKKKVCKVKKDKREAKKTQKANDVVK